MQGGMCSVKCTCEGAGVCLWGGGGVGPIDKLTDLTIAYRSFRYKVVSPHRNLVDMLRFKIGTFSNI